MAAIMKMLKLKLNQKRRSVRGTSMKKLVNSRVCAESVSTMVNQVGQWPTDLSGGTPCHVDLKHVREQSLRDMDGDASQKDKEQEEPLELFTERAQERAFTTSVAKSSASDVTDYCALAVKTFPSTKVQLTAIEDEDEHNPDVPRGDVVLVNVALVPADDEVVGGGKQPSSANGVVGSDVGDDIDLGRQSHVGPEKGLEQRCERPANEPEANWVKYQLVTTIGVLLPAGKLVVNLFMSVIAIFWCALQLTVRDTPSWNPSPAHAARRVM
jgi:hypothetical protein